MEDSSNFCTSQGRVSIIGIGGNAGRIVNEMQAINLDKTSLYAFGMNGSELACMSLQNKYLIGDGLGSGKNRIYAEKECTKSMSLIESVVNSSPNVVFVVSLGGGTGEGCIKTFLWAVDKEKTFCKLLAVTLPHPSEGEGKRERAISLLKEVEKDVDGILITDMNDLSGKTISEIFNKSNKKVVESVSSFVSLFVRMGVLCFDWNDVRYFLRYKSRTKCIDFFTLSGSIEDLNVELKNIRSSPKHQPLSDASALIAAVYLGNSEDDAVKELVNSVMPDIMSVKDWDMVSWNLYDGSATPEYDFRVDMFVKY